MQQKLLKHPLRLLLLCFALSATLPSCSREEEHLMEQERVVDADYYARVIRFISIAWQVDKSAIKHDKAAGTFSFREYTATEDEIYNLYDDANEYKLNYEK